jgi:hypothetical protein
MLGLNLAQHLYGQYLTPLQSEIGGELKIFPRLVLRLWSAITSLMLIHCFLLTFFMTMAERQDI